MTISNSDNVYSEENVSVDIQKMKAMQNNTGSQYLVKFRLKVILTFTPMRDRKVSSYTIIPNKQLIIKINEISSYL
jgi:hypothetical protein